MAAEIYQAQDPNPGEVQGPSPQAPTAGFQAMQQLGSEADVLAFHLARGRDQTELMNAKSQLLVAHSALNDKYTQDPAFNDFRTAPGDYASEAEQTKNSIVGAASAKLSPPAKAELDHFATTLNLSTGNQVKQAALAREAQFNIANWQTQAPLLQQRYVAAGSQAERDEIQAHGEQSIAGLASAGWIHPDVAAKERQAFDQGLQESYIAKVQQHDPAAAKALLDDASQFTAIPAERRIALQNNAGAAVDATGELKLGVLAKQNPSAAIAAVGRIDPADTNTIGAIFDKGVVSQESQNDPTAISPKGALGLSQLMPDTARAAATRIGRMDVAEMSDSQLRATLINDPSLNRQLGVNEFQRLVTKYQGDIPAALAGYNAGEGAADKWVAAAKAKFGDDWTPQQFQSVVNYGETKDYIGKVYGYLGAPMDRFGMTGNAVLRAQGQALDIGRQEEAAQGRTLAAGAALQRSEDQVTQVLQDGYPVDPGRLAAYRQTQSLAAAQGDGAAAAELRRLDMAEAQAPIMRAAYSMPPSALAATIASEQQRMATSGDVSPFEIARLKTMQTVQAQMDAAKTTNTIGLGERQGMFKSVPIDFSQSGSSAFGDAIAARAPQVMQAAAAYDGNVVPFKPEEVSQAKAVWGQMGPNEKATLAATLATNFKDPNVYEAAMRQIAGGNRLEMTAGILGGQDPQLAEKILTGAEMLKDPGVEAKIKGVREAITAAIPVGLYPNVQTNSDVSEAVAAVYAADKGAAHALIDPTDSAGIKAAIAEVTGPQVNIGGRMTPIPKEFAPGAVQHTLANLTADDVKPLGGLQPGLDPAWLGRNAQLLPLGLGSSNYQVLVNGQRVLTADGRNLQVDLRSFAAQQKARQDAAAKSAGAGSPPPADPQDFFGGGLK